jgi:hypothetical protein
MRRCCHRGLAVATAIVAAARIERGDAPERHGIDRTEADDRSMPHAATEVIRWRRRRDSAARS